MTEKRRYRITVETEPMEHEPVLVHVRDGSDLGSDILNTTITSCEPLPDPPRLATLEEIADGLVCDALDDSPSGQCRRSAVAMKTHTGAIRSGRCRIHARSGDLYLRIPDGGE